MASFIPEHIDILGPNYPYYVYNLSGITEIVNTIKRAISDPPINTDFQFAKSKLQKMKPNIVANIYHDLFLQVLQTKIKI